MKEYIITKRFKATLIGSDRVQEFEAEYQVRECDDGAIVEQMVYGSLRPASEE